MMWKIIVHPHTPNILCNTRYSIISNKQNAKVICRFDRLRTAHSGKFSAANAFDYLVLRDNPGLSSCENLATALTKLGHISLQTHALIFQYQVTFDPFI